jgi:hypothetical protein
MRTELLAAITTAISTLTQFAVSSELPWSQNGTPLYIKNMKRVYVDLERVEQTTMFPTLNGGEVFQNDSICEVYVSMDAKNQPSQLDSLITKILGAKNSTGIVNFGVESDYTLDKQEDVLIYTFEFRLNQATT